MTDTAIAARMTTKVTQENFGCVDGAKVTKFRITNSSGAELHLISYGAAITNLIVPDKNGQMRDVVLGFDNLEGQSQICQHFLEADCVHKY